MKNNKLVIKFILLLVFYSFNSSKICYSQTIFDDIRMGISLDLGVASNSITVFDEADPKYILNNSNKWKYAGYYGLFATVPAFKINENKVYGGIRALFLGNYYDFTDDAKQINIKSSFDWFAIEPLLQYEIGKNFITSFGLQFNIPLNSSGRINYLQDNKQEFFLYNSNLHYKLHLGVGYSIPLTTTKSFSLIPNFNVLLGLNNLVGSEFNGNWKSSIFSFGFAFQYDNQKKPFFIDERNIKIDTVRRIVALGKERIVIGKPVLIDSTTILSAPNTKEHLVTYTYKRTDTLFIPTEKLFGFDIEQITTEIDIAEILVTEEQPLLNYIFFDRNSYRINSRYITLRNATQATNFDIEEIKLQAEEWTALNSYYQMLNIVGQRMRQNRSYTLTITGYNDGYTEGEINNFELSQSRAETVRNYLRNVWQISDSRLTINFNGLPKNPSLRESEWLKQQENRRVELIPNDISLFDPISFESKQYIKSVDKLKLKAKIFSEYEIVNYTIVLSNGDNIVSTNSVNNPKYNNGEVDIDYELDYNYIPWVSENKYNISIIATDKYHANRLYRASIPVNFTTAEENREKQIHKYSLILFDFNTFRIGDRNTRIIKDIVDRTNPESEIEITGHTDITGREETNLRLSQQRAEAAKKALDFRNAKTIATDNSIILLYDNDTPEGRFYCRTVDIIVYPPLSDKRKK